MPKTIRKRCTIKKALPIIKRYNPNPPTSRKASGEQQASAPDGAAEPVGRRVQGAKVGGGHAALPATVLVHGEFHVGLARQGLGFFKTTRIQATATP